MGSKLKIKESVANWGGYELDGSLEDAIAKLQGLISDNPNLFDFKIEIETESGYYNSCSTNIIVWAYRWETDKEFQDRELASKEKSAMEKAKKKRDQELAEKKERELYESLKRKFEKELDS